jgi:hypothetical protein
MIAAVLLTSQQLYCYKVMQSSLQMLRAVKTEDQERHDSATVAEEPKAGQHLARYSQLLAVLKLALERTSGF